MHLRFDNACESLAYLVMWTYPWLGIVAIATFVVGVAFLLGRWSKR